MYFARSLFITQNIDHPLEAVDRGVITDNISQNEDGTQ